MTRSTFRPGRTGIPVIRWGRYPKRSANTSNSPGGSTLIVNRPVYEVVTTRVSPDVVSVRTTETSPRGRPSGPWTTPPTVPPVRLCARTVDANASDINDALTPQAMKRGNRLIWGTERDEGVVSAGRLNGPELSAAIIIFSVGTRNPGPDRAEIGDGVSNVRGNACRLRTGGGLGQESDHDRRPHPRGAAPDPHGRFRPRRRAEHGGSLRWRCAGPNVVRPPAWARVWDAGVGCAGSGGKDATVPGPRGGCRAGTGSGTDSAPLRRPPRGVRAGTDRNDSSKARRERRSSTADAAGVTGRTVQDPLETDRGKPSRRGAGWLIKLVVSGLLIAWVVGRADLAQVLAALKSAKPGYVVVAALTYPVGWTISITRWRL